MLDPSLHDRAKDEVIGPRDPKKDCRICGHPKGSHRGGRKCHGYKGICGDRCQKFKPYPGY